MGFTTEDFDKALALIGQYAATLPPSGAKSNLQATIDYLRYVGSGSVLATLAPGPKYKHVNPEVAWLSERGPMLLPKQEADDQC